MICFVKGKLVYTGMNIAVVEVGGVGFRLNVSDKTLGRLALHESDEDVRLFTYMNVREDAIELCGFYSEEELSLFKMLISVSGVGMKAALAILSEHTVESVVFCVMADDAKSIARAQGIGIKTAQKIILELKDKISKEHNNTQITQKAFLASADTAKNVKGTAVEEAIDALSILGYTRQESMKVLGKLQTKNKTVEQLIKEALKALSPNR